MVPEARLESTDHGLVPKGDGWFMLNARDARWRQAEGRGAVCDLEGEPEFPQLGIHLFVLGPGEPMSMYHWEADQEDFLVLSGEALLIVEGEKRPLRQWDLAHCPAGTKHVVIGAGDADCLVLAVGARVHSTGPEWGGYTVDEAALRHSAGVEQETTDAYEAYARVPKREPTRYREGWLPEYMENDPPAKPQSARLDEVERLLAESGHDLPVVRARVAVARSGVALGFRRDPILHVSWWALSAVAGLAGALFVRRSRKG